jgi:hypothetical protein
MGRADPPHSLLRIATAYEALADRVEELVVEPLTVGGE